MPLIIIATRELTKIINEHYTPMRPIGPTCMISLTIKTSPAPSIFLPHPLQWHKTFGTAAPVCHIK